MCFLSIVHAYTYMLINALTCKIKKSRERKREREKQMIRNKFSRKEEKEYSEQERRRVAMVTIKGADQTRRGEISPFIADFVTQKPPPRNRRIHSLCVTSPIHPLTLVLSSFTGVERICGIETSMLAKKKKSGAVTSTMQLKSSYIFNF